MYFVYSSAISHNNYNGKSLRGKISIENNHIKVELKTMNIIIFPDFSKVDKDPTKYETVVLIALTFCLHGNIISIYMYLFLIF